eukprot:TRINITY_DN14096_c0_g3_i1.p1 TRINITY_DN14096_c0_g3~~TRINITY_DN14096_c0_g3_i1.p1  ORF type:complete len:403 (-),score=30.19 TRINITY_DN14096_c0_g3_i1:597-1778(-)
MISVQTSLYCVQIAAVGRADLGWFLACVALNLGFSGCTRVASRSGFTRAREMNTNSYFPFIMFDFAMLARFVFSFLCLQRVCSLQMEGGKLSTHLDGQAEHSHKRILFIGSSVDRFAIYFYCNKFNATVFADTSFTRSLDDGLQLAQGCFTEHFTLAYMFIPGSGPPPYFQCEHKPTLCGNNSLLLPGMTHATPHEIVEFDAPDFAARNFGGSSPDIVMIEASNWDVAAWHANEGLGNSSDWPPAVLETHVEQWVLSWANRIYNSLPENDYGERRNKMPRHKNKNRQYILRRFDSVPILLISKYIKVRSSLLLGHILRADDGNAMKQVLLRQDLSPKFFNKNRVGRKRLEWLKETASFAWEHIKHKLNVDDSFDISSEHHRFLLANAAENRLI